MVGGLLKIRCHPKSERHFLIVPVYILICLVLITLGVIVNKKNEFLMS